MLVVLAAAWALAGKQVADRKAEVAQRQRRGRPPPRPAPASSSPTRSSRELRAKRVETVTSLARSRFDWPHALREVSRMLPDDAWLTSIVGTVAPACTLEGAGGGATTRCATQLAAPALEVVGCTDEPGRGRRSWRACARMDGVTRVALASSEKVDVDRGRRPAAARRRQRRRLPQRQPRDPAVRPRRLLRGLDGQRRAPATRRRGARGHRHARPRPTATEGAAK